MNGTPEPRLDDNGNIRIAIVGSREWPEAELHTIDAYMESRPANVHYISGGGGRVDLRVREVAARLGRLFTEHLPDLTNLPTNERRRRFEIVHRYYARNKRVVMDAFYVVAFWNPKSKTRGTVNAVKHARDNERPVMVILPRGVDPSKKENRI